MVNRVEEAADVGIEHPVHALAHDRRVQRRQSLVRVPRPAGSRRRTRGSRPRRWRSAPRRPRPGRSCPPGSARRAGAARHRLWGCRRAAPAVAGSARCGLGRTGPAACPPGPARTSSTVIPSTPAARPSLLSPERSSERLDVDVVQQGGEPGLRGSAGRLVHPRERWRQATPALRPVLRAPR